jgi:hypothetical protein
LIFGVRIVDHQDGDLLSYGTDRVDLFHRAATYPDFPEVGLCRSHSARREAGDLPVQFPTKFEMVVNRKTATALGLAIPPSILLRADEGDRVIEPLNVIRSQSQELLMLGLKHKAEAHKTHWLIKAQATLERSLQNIRSPDEWEQDFSQGQMQAPRAPRGAFDHSPLDEVERHN